MSVLIEDITEVALELPVEARTKLVRTLLESLDPVDETEETQAAQLKEIRRRVEEIKNGTAELIDGDLVFAKIDKLIAE